MPKKSKNLCVDDLRHAEYYGMQPVFDELYRRSLDGDNFTDLMDTLQMLGLGDAVSGYLAEQILQTFAFLITLLLAGVLVRGIAFSLGLAAKLPVLHGINKLAGLVFGFGEGLLVVWIFFFVVTVFSPTNWGGEMFAMISDSRILTWLYRENILFGLL